MTRLLGTPHMRRARGTNSPQLSRLPTTRRSPVTSIIFSTPRTPCLTSDVGRGYWSSTWRPPSTNDTPASISPMSRSQRPERDTPRGRLSIFDVLQSNGTPFLPTRSMGLVFNEVLYYL